MGDASLFRRERTLLVKRLGPRERGGATINKAGVNDGRVKDCLSFAITASSDRCDSN